MLEMYSSPVSPAGLRVQLAAVAKGVPIRSRKLPPGGVRSDAFLGLNPIGKIPVLVTEDGIAIAESAAILGYVEQRFPSPSLWPADAGARAKMDSACRAVDLYLCESIIRLFPQLAPASRDPAVVAREVENWRRGAERVAQMVSVSLVPVEAEYSMLDCMLAPSLHLSRRISAMLELAEDPATSGGLQPSYDAYLAHTGIGPALRTLTDEQERYDLAAGRPSVAASH